MTEKQAAQPYRDLFWPGRIVRIRPDAPMCGGKLGVVRYTDGENVVVRVGRLAVPCLLSNRELDAL